MSCTKMAETIEMPFGAWTLVGPWYHVFHRMQITTAEEAISAVSGPFKSIVKHKISGVR